MNDETVTLNAEQLAKHAMYQAYESPDEYHLGQIPDEVSDVSLCDAHKHITEVDEITTESRHGPSFSDELAEDEVLDGLAVEAEMAATVSERTSRATRHHPAEYKNHDADVFVMAWWFPRDQLTPLTAIDVDVEMPSAATPAPDPEPYDL
jgi:hypothetical protein